MTRAVDSWLDAYGSSHVHPVNEAFHLVCVPVIVMCVLAGLRLVPLPFTPPLPWLDLAGLVTLAALAYYARLSWRLALAIIPALVVLFLGIDALEAWAARGGPALWQSALALFVAAWIGQFIGHLIEGKRPSFFQDLQFLLIGPVWLLAQAFKRVGLKY